MRMRGMSRCIIGHGKKWYDISRTRKETTEREAMIPTKSKDKP
jgi:hypothetical protein